MNKLKLSVNKYVVSTGVTVLILGTAITGGVLVEGIVTWLMPVIGLAPMPPGNLGLVTTVTAVCAILTAMVRGMMESS